MAFGSTPDRSGSTTPEVSHSLIKDMTQEEFDRLAVKNWDKDGGVHVTWPEMGGHWTIYREPPDIRVDNPRIRLV